MVICRALGADLHMSQHMPLPLTVSCFSKIQIGSTFLVPAHPGSPGKRAVKRMCVCVMNIKNSPTCIRTVVVIVVFGGVRRGVIVSFGARRQRRRCNQRDYQEEHATDSTTTHRELRCCDSGNATTLVYSSAARRISWILMISKATYSLIRDRNYCITVIRRVRRKRPRAILLRDVARRFV